MAPNNKPVNIHGVQDVHLCALRAHAESAEERQADQGSRAEREAFPDGRRGVPRRVQAIGEVMYVRWEARHLRDPAWVVRDRPLGVDGQGHGQRAQPPQGSQGDAKHAAERMRDQDGDAQADDRHDAREVA